MMRRIPLIPLQRAIFQTLAPPIYVNGVPVYDDIPEYLMDENGELVLGNDGKPIPPTLPYITFGAFTYKPNGGKGTDISDVSLQLHIWSNYRGKKEVNEIANDIITILSAVQLNLAADGFYVMDQGTDFFESFPEEDGSYQGVITFVAKIQNVGGI